MPLLNCCNSPTGTLRVGLTLVLGLMPKIRRDLGKAVGYPLFASAAFGVLAWNTREKCLAGTGLLSDLGFTCPSTAALALAIAILAVAVIVVTQLQGRDAPNQKGNIDGA